MLLTEVMNDGPAYYNTSGVKITLLDTGTTSVGTIMTTQRDCERGEPTTMGCSAPTGPGASDTYLQDTRDFLALHQGTCNVLMGDGSVKGFFDGNGDGYLNPGFPVPTGLTDSQYSNIGYRDGVRELSPDAFFAGLFLDDSMFKGKFEN